MRQIASPSAGVSVRPVDFVLVVEGTNGTVFRHNDKDMSEHEREGGFSASSRVI